MKSSVSGTLIGNGASLLAYLIFGINIVMCKSISNCGMVSPFALFCMRTGGAMILFWMLSFVVDSIRKRASEGSKYSILVAEFQNKTGIVLRRNRMEPSDLWKVALASFLGLFLTLISFLKAITMCTAVDASIMSLLTPIMTMLVAAVAIKDRITRHGVIGLVISLAGVLFIVMHSVSGGGGAKSTSIWGVLLMIVNTFSFACYVGIFKPLIQKYSVVTFMKWMFLFATLYALPFAAKDLMELPYSQLPSDIVWQIVCVVFFATFVAYFLIPIGQKTLKPMVVCMYSYVQPIVAMLAALAAGIDTMTWGKALASVLVFIGVGIVNFSPKHRRIRKFAWRIGRKQERFLFIIIFVFII
ncbi:MAG: DMT family transporter [Bacteroidales bacterium]|nr:DMT family transporter [Bacteroidales bacterium]